MVILLLVMLPRETLKIDFLKIVRAKNQKKVNRLSQNLCMFLKLITLVRTLKTMIVHLIFFTGSQHQNIKILNVLLDFNIRKRI